MCLSRTGAGDGQSKGSANIKIGGNVKLGKPRFEMSGPLAEMVQQRLRQRNEL